MCQVSSTIIFYNNHNLHNFSSLLISLFLKAFLFYWYLSQGLKLNGFNQLNKKEGTITEIDVKTCQERCKSKQKCQWHSYNKKTKFCTHWETCPTMSTNTDFVSGQSECSDSHNEFDDPKLDNHELDNPYKCNQTGMCLVSYHTFRKVASRSTSLLVSMSWFIK